MCRICLISNKVSTKSCSKFKTAYTKLIAQIYIQFVLFQGQNKDKIINDATFYKILPSGSSPGVLYGLPKVHKTGCPFRPIVSSVNTYNYNLASYLVQPISTNRYTVKDSFSFADWAKKYMHKNGIMCSLDVSSLFTNVPARGNTKHFSRVVLRKLLEFATKKSHFLVDGKYYDQIDDIAMGSPLGPILGQHFYV